MAPSGRCVNTLLTEHARRMTTHGQGHDPDSRASQTGSIANFATQIFRLPGSFASLGSRDLPHREGLGVLGVSIDPLAGVGDGDREALVLESEEIHRLFVLVVYHQKEEKNQ